MSYYGALEVVDRTGWARTFPLEKALLMVGSADFNDIVLPEERGLGVAPAHLQVMRPAVDLGSICVVNLSAAPVTLLKNGLARGSLPGGSTAELEDGDGLLLAEYHLTFAIQSQGGIVRSARSEHLGLKLELPGPNLRPLKQLAGRLTVTNFGSLPHCQFEVELEGLPADCFQIDPAPLLFPHGEEQLQIRFFHCGSRPAGGLQALILRASAPNTYPTEEVDLVWNLDVAKVQSVQLALNEDPVAPWKREAIEREEVEVRGRLLATARSERAQSRTQSRAGANKPSDQAGTNDMPLSNELDDSTGEDSARLDTVVANDRIKEHDLQLFDDAGDEPISQALSGPDPAHLSAARPRSDPSPTADSEWWTASPGSVEAPAARISAVRRPRARINGKNIPVLRITPEQMADANTPSIPSPETGEDAQP